MFKSVNTEYIGPEGCNSILFIRKIIIIQLLKIFLNSKELIKRFDLKVSHRNSSFNMPSMA